MGAAVLVQIVHGPKMNGVSSYFISWFTQLEVGGLENSHQGHHTSNKYTVDMRKRRT